MNVLTKLLKGKTLTKGDYHKPIADDKTLNEINATSFVDLLAIKQYTGNGIFYFRDIERLGCACKITPISLESSSQETQEEIFESITFAMSNSIPNEYKNLWLSQMFVVKNQSNDVVYNSIKKYIKKDNLNTKFSQNYLKVVQDHLKDLSNPKGAFIDKNTGRPWALTQLEVYLCFYQESEKPTQLDEEFNKITEVFERLKSGLSQAKIEINPLNTQEYINFLSLFFHKDKVDYKVEEHNGLNLLDTDISQLALNNCKILCKQGIWQFDTKKMSIYSSYLALEEITKSLNLGHLTAEQKDKLSLVDRMPYGSIWHQTTVHLHTDNSNELLDKIIKQSMGTDDAVIANRDIALEAKAQNAAGNFLYRFAAGIFLQCDNKLGIDKSIRDIKSAFGANGLELLRPDQNPLAQNDFIKSLPFNFNYKYDQKGFAKRAILTSMADVCLLSPFYGRSSGTGSAGLLFYNRGGEAILFDPLADREKNAFGLIFGPMGSGKSAFLIYYLMQLIAIYNPKIFIIEKGDSFGLLLEHCKSLGLSTHRLSIKAGSKDIQLPPFADATKIITDKNTEDDDRVKRDILGELLIIAKLMITGGEANEEKRFERSDWNTVSEAIKLAAENTLADNRDTTLTEDVIKALEILSQKDGLTTNETEKIRKMAKSMSVFIDTDFNNNMFNTKGKLFPDVDITQLDVGILGDEGYADKLAVAFISLMSNINVIAEKNQFEERPIIILVDEAHLITTNPLLAPYIAKIAKMWRKLGAWLWLATQSLADYPDKSKQMLSVMEWWICLSMGKAEVEELARFKTLTNEQKELLVSATKSKRQYTEGVVLSDRLESSFRNVPPALALALAMTEKDEKAMRQKLMQEHNITELEAVYKIADDISSSRRGVS